MSVRGCGAAEGEGDGAGADSVELEVGDARVDAAGAVAAVCWLDVSLWEACCFGFSFGEIVRHTYLISEPSASDIHSSVAPWATSLSQMTWLLSPSQLGSRSFGSLEKGVELPVFRSSTRTSALWMRDEREYLWGVYIARVPSGLGDADNLRLWLWLHCSYYYQRKAA